MQRRTFVRSSAAVAALGALGRHPLSALDLSADTPLADDTKFTALRDQYFVRHLELNPVTSTYLGGDGYNSALRTANGQLRDYSPPAMQREAGMYKDMRAAVAAIDPATLSVQARIDHQVMLGQLDFLTRLIGERRHQERAIDTFVAEPFRGVDWQIQQMTPGTGAELGTREEWSRVFTRIAAIPEYLGIVQGQLREGKKAGNLADHRMITRDGIDGAKANATYFRTTLPALARTYLGKRPFASGIMSGLGETCIIAAAAWEKFAQFLTTEYGIDTSKDRYAAGEEEYAWRVKHILRDARTPAELYEYGAAQVALYTDKIVEVARKISESDKLGLAFGSPTEKAASVRKVMEHLSSVAPKDDAELFTWYRETGARAVAYGRERGMFDIPTDYRLDVIETPPVLRSTLDAAYYPAPPFKKTGVGRFYLTPTGNDPAALRAQNRASIADTAVHEGFPGHDWHYKYMTANAKEISNIRWLTPGAVEDSSSMWSDSMASEGWGLYAEELMAEPTADRPYGFYDAGEFMYELQGQLLRAVRVRVDVGLHTGRMTFDEAIDYFTEHVDFFPNARTRAANDPAARAVADSALRAIYRYSKWPTQAITYNLGKNAIISLREAVRTKEGAAFSARAFHERFMRLGTVPASYMWEAFSVKSA